MALPSQQRHYLDFEDNGIIDEFLLNQGSPYTPPLASMGYQYATQQGGIGADQYYSNISNYINNVLADPSLNEVRRATNLRQAADEFGVSDQDIARATGMDLSAINTMFNPTRTSTQEDSTASTMSALDAVSFPTGAATTTAAPGSDLIQASTASDQLLTRADADRTEADTTAASEIVQTSVPGGLSVTDTVTQDTVTGGQGALSTVTTTDEDIRNVADAVRAGNVDVNDVAAATNQSTDEVISGLAQTNINSAANNDTANMVVAENGYFSANPDVAAAYVTSGAAATMSPEEYAEQHWLNTGKDEGRTGPNGEAAKDEEKVYDYRGKAYDKTTLLALAAQIIPNLGSMAGGAFGTKGESIGFDFNEAKRILGKEPTAAEQVILDMARGLLDRGITDISQLQVKDVFSDLDVYEELDDIGRPTGNYIATMVDPNDPDKTIQRVLTPEEASRITSQSMYDAEGGEIIRKTANDILTGKAVYLGDDVLTQVNSGLSPLVIGIGGTATGQGATEYQIVINPTTGKPEFQTYGKDTGVTKQIGAILSVASFIPGVQPFAMIANAALAASQGNVVGALASLAGAGGYTNVATALNVANAIQSGNPTAIVSTLLSNPNVANAAGATMLTDTISLADVGTALNVVDAASKGNFAAVLTGAGTLLNSADLQTAGTAAELLQAVQSGNVGAITNSLMRLSSTIAAADNLNNKDTVSDLVSNVNKSTVSDYGEDDLGAAAYAAAISAGATEEEALAASNAVTNSIASIGSDTKVTSETGDVKTDLMSGVTMSNVDDIDVWSGLSDAIKDATERNTLNISNDQADDLDQAAAMAGARGFSTFTYDGKTYNITASSQELAQQIANAEISVATSFSDAYKIARNAFGPGQVFEWNGKKYSTDTREENPSLAAASDQIRYAQVGAGGGKGSYANYDAKTAADEFANLNPDVVNTDMPVVTFGTMDDFLLAGGVGGDYVVVDDKISKSLINPVVKTVGTVVRAGGNFLDNMAGGLQAVNVIDKNSAIVRIANDMEKWGSDRMGEYLIGAEKNVIDRVNKVEGFDEKFIELGKALWDNPSAILTMGSNEFFEEGVPLLTGAAALKYGGKLLALGADAFMNAWEAGGANYNETKKAAIDAGMSEADAHTAAQKSAAGAGAVASVLGPAADMPWLKRAGSAATGAADTGAKVIAKETGKAAGREAVTEYPEEFAASVMSDYFATGTIDLNKAMTQGTIGSVVAGKAVGTITVVSEVSRAGNSTTEIIESSASSPDQAASLTNAINSSLTPGVDLKEAGSNIFTAMTDSGMNPAQAQNVANTAVAEQVVNNLASSGGLKINDLNIAVGTDQGGNSITLGDFIGSSITGSGTNGNVYVAPDIFIGFNANNQPITVGDLSNLSSLGKTAAETKTAGADSTTVSSGGETDTTINNASTNTTTNISTNTNTDTREETTVNNTTGAETTTVSDASTGAETTASTDLTTGTDTVTATDPTTGATTETTIDSNTGINTAVTTDTNNNTQTTTTTDTNNNTTTQTTVNNNTGVTTETTTDTNNNTNTQVTTDTNNNTQTTTTTNTETNVTTQTTVNTETGVTTEVTTNSEGQVTTEVVTDPTTNTETTTETNTETNTETKTVVDLNTNTVISTTQKPVDEIKTVDPVDSVDPVEEEEDEEEKKKKQARRRALAAPGLAMMAGAPITGIKPQLLRSFVTGEKKIDPLERVRDIQEEMEREAMVENIDPRLASILKQRMGPQEEDLSGLDTLARVLSGGGFDPVKAAEAEKNAYYSYGQEDSIDDILSGYGPLGFAQGGFVEPLMARGGMALPLLAKEGGLPKMAKGREDFRDGKHVAGEGDGQSDDIPAMLADGEFVFPADVVSALGNGSTKAGTDKLYQMMHEIRARARSSGKKDLPPPALKSPLDYLKSKR